MRYWTYNRSKVDLGGSVLVEVRELLPPFLVRQLLRMGLGGNKFKYGYSSWGEAEAHSSGYDVSSILDTVRKASLGVRDGKSAFERDGVVFDRIQYSWPLLASLLATPVQGNLLRVMDWGGALGSSYRQNRRYLVDSGKSISWSVVEQQDFVEVGNADFANDELKFYKNLDEFPFGSFDTALFASSICYVPDYEQVLSKVIELSPKTIIFDRTPEARGQSNLFGVQTVGKKIYRASYPIVSFGIGEIERMLEPKYKLVESWVCDLQPDPNTTSVGHYFTRRD